MTDVVVTLPIQIGEESTLFGRYLNTFVESRSFEADALAEACDAPFMMVRSDPGDGEEIKVLIFQQTKMASDFSTGWAQARRRQTGVSVDQAEY
jgi:hypothetical protein